MRKNSFAAASFVICLAVCFSTPLQAGVVSLSSSTLDDLVGGNPVLVGTDVVSTLLNGDSLRAEVVSAAFTGDGGDYVYLYQVDNVGVAGNTATEMFTLWPFRGATSNTLLGRLTGDLPAGFLSGGVAGEDVAFIDEPSQDPVISFYFPKLYGKHIDIGQHSMVLFVKSPYSPDTIIGNVIGGTAQTGLVVGPVAVPEPSTIAYLLIGSLMTVAALARRQSTNH